MATRKPPPVSGTKIVLGTAIGGLGVSLIAFGTIGTVLMWSIFRDSTVLTPTSNVLLAVSLIGFVATILFGGWTLVELARNRIEAANRRRWIGLAVLAGAIAFWVLAAVAT